MTLYTVMPIEEVMKEGERRQMVEIRVRGRIVQVEPISPSEGRIMRIISSDPQDYLDDSLQPGGVINLWGAP